MKRHFIAAIAVGILVVGPSMCKAVSIFSQNFEADTLGTAAGWTPGLRDPGHFTTNNPNSNPIGQDPTAAVINTDSVSPSQSLRFSGTPDGYSLHAWRDYNGLSSDGLQPITVQFDFKINGYAGNLEITPFIYHNSLFGTSGAAGQDVFGWPVATLIKANGDVVHLEDSLAGDQTFLTGYTLGDWARYTATLDPVSQEVDIAVTILTGVNATATGSITNGKFAYGNITDAGYYNNAMDELRGVGFSTQKDSQVGFFSNQSILVDNFSVVVGVPEPAGFSLLGLSAVALLQIVRRRRMV